MMKKTFADILAKEAAVMDRKLASKLPEWASVEGLSVPTSLSFEQCSSTPAALYKAEIASGYGSVIWDLTGGLGVDSWAFSRYFSLVHYNEMDAALYSSVSSNFERLGLKNVEMSFGDCEVLAGTISGDVAYLDPARRSDTGKKVFLVGDCRPDVKKLLPSLLENFRIVMVKLSPMADVSLLAREFEGHLKEIHIVGLGGECKELLCLLDTEKHSNYKVVVKDLDSGDGFEFLSDEETAEEQLAVDDNFLVEPKPVLMKSGRFDLIASRFGIRHMDRSTHLYLSDHILENGLVKCFRIEQVLDFGKKGFETVRKEFPHAEVTARNVPMSSDELRKRLGVLPGGDYHIFACTCGTVRRLFVTRKCGGISDMEGAEV